MRLALKVALGVASAVLAYFIVFLVVIPLMMATLFAYHPSSSATTTTSINYTYYNWVDCDVPFIGKPMSPQQAQELLQYGSLVQYSSGRPTPTQAWLWNHTVYYGPQKLLSNRTLYDEVQALINLVTNGPSYNSTYVELAERYLGNMTSGYDFTVEYLESASFFQPYCYSYAPSPTQRLQESNESWLPAVRLGRINLPYGVSIYVVIFYSNSTDSFVAGVYETVTNITAFEQFLAYANVLDAVIYQLNLGSFGESYTDLITPPNNYTWASYNVTALWHTLFLAYAYGSSYNVSYLGAAGLAYGNLSEPVDYVSLVVTLPSYAFRTRMGSGYFYAVDDLEADLMAPAVTLASSFWDNGASGLLSQMQELVSYNYTAYDYDLFDAGRFYDYIPMQPYATWFTLIEDGQGECADFAEAFGMAYTNMAGALGALEDLTIPYISGRPNGHEVYLAFQPSPGVQLPGSVLGLNYTGVGAYFVDQVDTAGLPVDMLNGSEKNVNFFGLELPLMFFPYAYGNPSGWRTYAELYVPAFKLIGIPQAILSLPQPLWPVQLNSTELNYLDQALSIFNRTSWLNVTCGTIGGPLPWGYGSIENSLEAYPAIQQVVSQTPELVVPPGLGAISGIPTTASFANLTPAYSQVLSEVSAICQVQARG